MRILIVIILVLAIIIGVGGMIRIGRLHRAAVRWEINRLRRASARPDAPRPRLAGPTQPDEYAKNLGVARATGNVVLDAVALLMATAIVIMLMQPLIAGMTDDIPTSPPATPNARATQEGEQ